MDALDLWVLAAFTAGTLWLGLSRTVGQTTLTEYFTGGRRAPWTLVMASIVATETSTVTLVSLPGFAFGSNLTFLQLALGYLAGRILVTLFFIPRYFHQRYLTAYQVLTERFGQQVGQLASVLFLSTRNLADGFRLFATGLVLGAALLTLPGSAHLTTWLSPIIDPTTAVLLCAVLLLGLVTIAYTYFGGISAVLWTDLLQLCVYLVGSLAAAVVLFRLIPGGWDEIVDVATTAGRLRVIDFSTDLNRSYTFWSGLIGGACLTVSTHGTDQLIVQRYLSCRGPRDASKALLWSGLVVFCQFLLFLVIGVLLYVYYTGYSPDSLEMLAANGTLQTDRIFPTFIVTKLPSGLRGLMVAAIFAAAMSTLSSSLNASASATVADFYMPATGGRHSDKHYLRMARRSTVLWGCVQILTACIAIRISTRVVDEVLGISSFTNGLILGAFVLVLLGYRRAGTAFVGIAVGTVSVLALRIFTGVSWQWYVLIGGFTTAAAGYCVARVFERPKNDQ